LYEKIYSFDFTVDKVYLFICDRSSDATENFEIKIVSTMKMDEWAFFLLE